MTAVEIQDYIHVYSMFSFRDGSHIPGIVVNKYNTSTTQVEFYFIEHADMQSYKTAFEVYDRDACYRLSKKLDLDDIISVRPVSLADYKIIMQLMVEREEILKSAAKKTGID